MVKCNEVSTTPGRFLLVARIVFDAGEFFLSWSIVHTFRFVLRTKGFVLARLRLVLIRMLISYSEAGESERFERVSANVPT